MPKTLTKRKMSRKDEEAILDLCKRVPLFSLLETIQFYLDDLSHEEYEIVKDGDFTCDPSEYGYIAQDLEEWIDEQREKIKGEE